MANKCTCPVLLDFTFEDMILASYCMPSCNMPAPFQFLYVCSTYIFNWSAYSLFWNHLHESNNGKNTNLINLILFRVAY